MKNIKTLHLDFPEKKFGFGPRQTAHYYTLRFSPIFPSRRFAARLRNGANFRDTFSPTGEKNYN